MPMSQHRAALAAILVAVVAIFTLTAVPAFAAPAPSNPIAAKALTYDGSWQGECWQFVKKVVREATGNEMGFDYRQGFFDAGGVEVTVANAQPGDIIQIVDDANSGANADYPGLHTSIVIENLGGGNFHVIDSNQNYDGVVHHRENYSPAAAAARWGLDFHIYRIPVNPAKPAAAPSLTNTSTKPAAPVPPAPNQVLAAGDSAVVYTPGDILFLRPGPGRESGEIARLQHGTAVSVISAPVIAGGLAWVKVTTPAGEGWVAADYLSKEKPKPATTSGAGSVGPVLRYKAIIPLASID